MSEVLVKLGKERVCTVLPPTDTDTDTEVAKRLLGTLINFVAGVSPQSGDRVRSNLVSLLVGAVLHQSACNLDMLLMIPKVKCSFPLTTYYPLSIFDIAVLFAVLFVQCKYLKA